MPEARHLATFTHGLTDEQVADKERMLKEVLDNDSSLCPTIAELCVDFCVRHPEEATRIRETKEWESRESIHSEDNLLKTHAEFLKKNQ